MKVGSIAVFGVFAVVSTSGAQERTVTGVMQPRPGAEAEDIEVKVHPVPVDPASVPASESTLPDDDLVLGVVIDGRAMAYPIRYLALSEVVDDRVGDTPIAPSW